MKSTKVSDPNYFRFPRPIEGTIVVLLMVTFYFSLVDPVNVILDYFGPLGTLARYLSKHHYSLLQVILVCAVAAHAGEAIYAVIICRRRGISTPITVLWFIQTFLVGFPSLMQLTSYKPSKKLK